MPTVKCDNCGHSVEVEDATKRYRLPLFFIFLGTTILVFQHAFNKPSLILTILGGLSAIVGLIWLVVTRFRSGNIELLTKPIRGTNPPIMLVGQDTTMKEIRSKFNEVDPYLAVMFDGATSILSTNKQGTRGQVC